MAGPSIYVMICRMKHISVLKKEILEQFEYLAGKSSGYFVDGTLGFAGHSCAIAQQVESRPVSPSAIRGGKSKAKMIGIDKDQAALEQAKKNVAEAGLTDSFIFIHDDFKNINEILDELKIEQIDGCLLDLGVSSMQLDDKTRGFSFSDPDADLDMRMDQTQELDAKKVVNYYSEKQLEDIIRNYGEEKYAYRIAKNICKNRKHKQLETVGDLLYSIEPAIPIIEQRKSRIHFATRTFQAIRIEVNSELTILEQSIKDLVSRLKPGTRIAIISFHSLEDRIVKNTFRELASDCSCPPTSPICNCTKESEIKIITTKPITPSEEEARSNPRARSAKLRVAEKIVL